MISGETLIVDVDVVIVTNEADAAAAGMQLTYTARTKKLQKD